MKSLMKSTTASSFTWVTLLLAAGFFSLIYGVLYDVTMPLLEYSQAVNPNDPMRNFYADVVWSLLPLALVIAGIYRLVIESQRVDNEK